jgi:hypothetical protein
LANSGDLIIAQERRHAPVGLGDYPERVAASAVARLAVVYQAGRQTGCGRRTSLLHRSLSRPAYRRNPNRRANADTGTGLAGRGATFERSVRGNDLTGRK